MSELALGQAVIAAFSGLAACAAAAAAFAHWRTSQRQLQLSLWKRRFEVYTAYRDILAMAYQIQTVPDEAWLAMKRAEIAASFLFGPEVIAVLTRCQRWANKYVAHSSEGENLDREEVRELRKAQRESSDNAEVMLLRLKDAVSPYLDFSHIRK